MLEICNMHGPMLEFIKLFYFVRFEEEISGHTIDRPIIGTNTFRQASQTIHHVHGTGPQDPRSNNFGHFHSQEPPHMQGYPPGGVPPRGHPAGDRAPGGMPQGGIHPMGHPRGEGMPPRHGPPVGVPQGGIPPVHNMNPEMTGQNMPMDNMTYHQPPSQQFPVQQVPFPMPPMPPQIPAQFHPGMQQNVMPGMVPMVPMQLPTAVKAPAEHIGITPEQKKEWESAYGKQDPGGGKAKKKDKKFVRVAGGVVWEDNSLAEWDPSKLLTKLLNLGISFDNVVGRYRI